MKLQQVEGDRIDSACLSVCHKLQIAIIASSFLFLDGIEPFFGRQFPMTRSAKLVSLIFDLGPIKPKIYSPKLHKIAYNSACMADGLDRRCLGLPGGFRGWLIQ